MKINDYKGKNNISGKNVRKRRKELGLSQEELAARLQLAGLETSQRTISRIEIGSRVVQDYELNFYSKALNLSLEELLKED